MSAVVETLEELLAADSGNWKTRLALVEALVSEGMHLKATNVVSSVTELPFDHESRLYAARAYGLVNPASGLEVVQAILEEAPDNGAAHFEKAFLLQREAIDLESARSHYQNAVALDPTLADVTLQSSLFGEAEAGAISSAPELDANDWQGRLKLVQYYIDQSQGEKAADLVSEVTELPADDATKVLAARTFGLVDPSAGLNIIEDVLKHDPLNAAAHLEKAFLLHRKDSDAEASRVHYQTALRIDPSLADDYLEGVLFQETSIDQFQPKTEVSEAPKLDRSNLFFPAPGEYPVITLRESLEYTVEPLVQPSEVPEAPALEYIEQPVYRQTEHTARDEYWETAQNVYVHPEGQHQQEVVYDYQQPDDTIFTPAVTPDEIYVGALVNENGQAVANLSEKLKRNKGVLDQEQQRQNRDKIVSVFTGLGVSVAIILLLSFVVMAIPAPQPPALVASALPVVNEPAIEQQTMKKQQTLTQPEVAAPPPPSVDVVASSAISPIAMQSLDTSFDTFGAGMNFDASMSFGSGELSMGTIGESDGGMFGSSKTGGLIGTLYDLKQDRKRKDLVYGPGSNDRIQIAKEAIETITDKRYKIDAFDDWYQSKKKLGFTYLAIPSIHATEGPKAFDVERYVKPSGWLVHYTGTISAPASGQWRFAGVFDDILIVRINGKTVFESSFGRYDPKWLPEDKTTHPSPFKKSISYGDWVRIKEARIDILIAEVPGGWVGGTLLIQKRGEKYEEQDGRPILPVFSVVKLSKKDWKRLEGSEFEGFQYSKEEVPFFTH